MNGFDKYGLDMDVNGFGMDESYDVFGGTNAAGEIGCGVYAENAVERFHSDNDYFNAKLSRSGFDVECSEKVSKSFAGWFCVGGLAAVVGTVLCCCLRGSRDS